MYQFVRFKNKKTQEQSDKWWFAASTIDDVTEHTERYLKPVMQDGFDNAASKSIQAIFRYGDVELMLHPNGDVEKSICNVCCINHKPTPMALFETANNLLLTAYQQRIKEIFSGKTIYLEDGVKEFGFSPDYYEIAETRNSEKLEYPDTKPLTMNDVRYMQWEGGQHWYAKVGKLDVTDACNNQKWNSKDEAENAAKWFLTEINK